MIVISRLQNKQKVWPKLKSHLDRVHVDKKCEKIPILVIKSILEIKVALSAIITGIEANCVIPISLQPYGVNL